jgi:S-adenosylmethionine uptake transporter
MFLNKKGYYQGLFFQILTMTVSCANDVIAKFMGERLDSLQITFFRFFFGLVTLLPFIMTQGKQILKTKNLGFNITRGMLGVICIFMYVYSVVHLPLVEVVAILWSMPLFDIVLSIFFLKEKVSALRWVATILGFLGLSFITLYNSGNSVSFNLLYLVPVASSFLFALQDAMVKRNVETESKVTMLLYFAIVTSVVSFFPALCVWKTPTMREYLMLFLLGAGGNLIQYFFFRAYSAIDLSALSPSRYLEFLISAAFAFFFFAEIPGINVLIGALILIPSNLYLAYSETKKRRR